MSRKLKKQQVARLQFDIVKKEKKTKNTTKVQRMTKFHWKNFLRVMVITEKML